MQQKIPTEWFSRSDYIGDSASVTATRSLYRYNRESDGLHMLKISCFANVAMLYVRWTDCH